jgi:hypothetical protein
MAIGTITRLFQGEGAEQYDAVNEKIGLASEPPDGLISHSAGNSMAVSRSSTSGRLASISSGSLASECVP